MIELGEFEAKGSWDIGHSNGRMNRNGAEEEIITGR